MSGIQSTKQVPRISHAQMDINVCHMDAMRSGFRAMREGRNLSQIREI